MTTYNFPSVKILREKIQPTYLTLVMEVLTLMLQRNIRNSNSFKYHHGCKELNLVNLCFADDLMIFCHGDKMSVGIIKDTPKEFSESSGLFPILVKVLCSFGA